MALGRPSRVETKVKRSRHPDCRGGGGSRGRGRVNREKEAGLEHLGDVQGKVQWGRGAVMEE